MAEIIDLAHLVDWILTLYRNSTPVPVKGNQDKLAPTPAPENKESRLVPLLLAALGSFFHTYIHIYIYTHHLLTIAHIAIFIDAYVMGTIVISPHPTGIDSGGKTQ